jgi:hypothetical protein
MNIDFLDELASAFSPKARMGRKRKPAQLRGLSAPTGVQCCTPHYTPPRGANFAQPGPVLGPMGRSIPAELGPPLSIREVAKFIGCSPWTVRQTLMPRGLPHFRFAASGKLIFYTDQVARWIERQQQGGNTTK